jgi:purine-binding chemotaxis protein CheW
MSNTQQRLSLLCRVSAHLCALPLEHVVETMRPLPVEIVGSAPEFVSGLSIVRGVPLPVVDTGSLLGAGESRPTRFVTVKAGKRFVMLAVDAVLGLRAIPPDSLQELPPLLGDARAELITAIGAIDSELLLVLRTARVVPESFWAALELEGVSR